MKTVHALPLLLLPILTAFHGGGPEARGRTAAPIAAAPDSFIWQTDQFADVRILRYQVPGWEQLNPQQKQLAYYLNMAGLAGRDILWDQNHKHNLQVRRSLERILRDHKGDRTGAEWTNFLTYAKQVFFSNGIHHHYSNDKHEPAFSRAWFEKALADSKGALTPEAMEAIFNPAVDAKKVSLDASKDLVLASAVNFYGDDVSQGEVEAFYAPKESIESDEPLSYGLNSKLVRNANGQLEERVYKVGGLYGPALEESVKWLEKAVGVAENEAQKKALELLIQYYRTGDLKTWDDFNVAWVKDVNSTCLLYTSPSPRD